jgi:hypothetical protein
MALNVVTVSVMSSSPDAEPEEPALHPVARRAITAAPAMPAAVRVRAVFVKGHSLVPGRASVLPL